MSLIVALDYSDLESCRRLIRELEGLTSFYKIGSELFTSHGWNAVDLVQGLGGRVFLDLKLHDIPTTVARTARVIAEREVFMFNVHALGGLEMMKAAREAVDEGSFGKSKPLLIAVTILTSLKQKTLSEELGIQRPIREEVRVLAHKAKEAGLDGVVSSPEETEFLRREFEKPFLLVTPGIRPVGSEKNDQARSLSPKEALQRGADYLVVGRPVTQAPSPRRALEDILKSLR